MWIFLPMLAGGHEERAVFPICIWIRMFLGLLDAPDHSINKQKNVEKPGFLLFLSLKNDVNVRTFKRNEYKNSGKKIIFC